LLVYFLSSNKQTIVWSTIPVNKIKFIHLIKNWTACLEADLLAPFSLLDHIFYHTPNFQSSDIYFSNLK